MPHNRGCWGREWDPLSIVRTAGGLEVSRNQLLGLDLGEDSSLVYWERMGMEEGKPEELWGSFYPSYSNADPKHILNLIALAVTPVSPDYRKTMPKLDGLDYICINWINIQFQAVCCLLPQAKDFFPLPGFLINVLISVFWGFSWFCLFVCHQRLISTPTYPRQMVAWGGLAHVCGGTETFV